MFQLLVIEDDENAAALVRSMVERFPRSEEFAIEVADASILGGRLPEGCHADIAIVDIELGQDRQNGIDLVRRWFPESSGVQVIYATGYIEYCTAVYQTEHVSFLVKPLKQDELDFALDRALENIEKRQRETLAISANGSVKIVPAAKIEFVESKLRKVHVHMGSEVLQTYATLTEVESRLPDYFVRCHKSFLVNMNLIAEIKATNVTMCSGSVVPISQGRRKEVKGRFAKFLAFPAAD